MATKSYKIRVADIPSRNGGPSLPQYSVTLPADLAGPLSDAGFRVRFEVVEDGILIIPVPAEDLTKDADLREKAEALVNRFTSGKEG